MAAALRQSEQRLRSMVENAPAFIVSVERDGTIASINRTLSELTVEETVGRSVYEFIPVEHHDIIRRALHRVYDTGLPDQYELMGAGPEGRPAWYSTHIAPIEDGDRVAEAVLISIDITERRRAEQALEQYQKMADSTSDLMAFVDRDYVYQAVNQSMVDAHGKTKDDFVGHSVPEIIGEFFYTGVIKNKLDEALAGEIATYDSWYHFKTLGQRYVEASYYPFVESDGTISGVVVTVHDITDRKRFEETLLEARDEAEAANRAKSQFLASMSHELRTPLNSVIGFAGLLRKNQSGALSQKDLLYLDRIHANGRHLLEVINRVLDLSKIEAGQIEFDIAPVDLAALTTEVLAQFEAQTESSAVALRSSIPDSLERVPTDPARFKQILINLVGNALKFTEEGSVTVRIEAHETSFRPLRIDVIDTGIGISKELLEVIFENFRQAELGAARRYEGTGLGLAISRSLCQLLGWRLEVQSELGRGSTFSIHLTPPEPEVHKG